MAVPQCSGVQLKWSLKVNLTQIQYFWRACPWLVGISGLLRSVVTWVGCTAVKMLRPIQWCKKLLVEMTKMGDAVSLECRTEWWAVSYLSATIKLPLTLWKTLDSAEIPGCFLLFWGFFCLGYFCFVFVFLERGNSKLSCKPLILRIHQESTLNSYRTVYESCNLFSFKCM